MPRTHALTPLLATLLLCASHSRAQISFGRPGGPTSADYKPPALSMMPLLESSKVLPQALINLARTGDKASFTQAIESGAAAGDIGAELYLAESYIPEQCPFEPDHDRPNCKQHPLPPAPHPLNITQSYEQAANLLERLSAQGCGEASEVLAQLITRMLANGHPTNYTAADSTRFHALARSQGFDLESFEIRCYQHTANEGPLHITGIPDLSRYPSLPNQHQPVPLSPAQLAALENLGVHGELQWEGAAGSGGRVILSQPEGPKINVGVILDHPPAQEVHLRIPAHRDAIYLQQGDRFLLVPADTPTLPRYISIVPGVQQIMIHAQNIDGGFSGGSCARF